MGSFKGAGHGHLHALRAFNEEIPARHECDGDPTGTYGEAD